MYLWASVAHAGSNDAQQQTISSQKLGLLATVSTGSFQDGPSPEVLQQIPGMHAPKLTDLHTCKSRNFLLVFQQLHKAVLHLIRDIHIADAAGNTVYHFKHGVWNPKMAMNLTASI